jgi:low affinity Fe/Cu permease
MKSKDPRKPVAIPARKKANFFDTFSARVTRVAGSPAAFFSAISIVILWGITGPLFHFSDTWQLVINTGTTIITFLMVFLIQQSQNKDTVAIHLKLNELIAATQGASNRLIEVEELTDAELQVLKKFYIQLSELAKKDSDLTCTHSIEEATDRHNVKLSAGGKLETK